MEITEVINVLLPAIIFLLFAIIMNAIESYIKLANNEARLIEIIYELEERIDILENERVA